MASYDQLGDGDTKEKTFTLEELQKIDKIIMRDLYVRSAISLIIMLTVFGFTYLAMFGGERK